MPAEEQQSGGMRSGAHGGLMCPLEKGVRGIETSGSGYLRQQIRGGRKGRAERQGLGQSPNKITRLGGLTGQQKLRRPLSRIMKRWRQRRLRMPKLG